MRQLLIIVAPAVVGARFLLVSRFLKGDRALPRRRRVVRVLRVRAFFEHSLRELFLSRCAGTAAFLRLLSSLCFSDPLLRPDHTRARRTLLATAAAGLPTPDGPRVVRTAAPR